MNVYTTVDSPIGRLVLVGKESASGIVLDTLSVDPDPSVHTGARAAPAAFGHVIGWLHGYFAGDRTPLDVPYTNRGTEFQRRVWTAVAEIPYGSTVSYGQLAERVGAPRDRIRAVAAAVGANRLLIVRPCHRVIGADGTLTGYAAGVERKRYLLVHEGALQPELV
jgi:methylated-DNA-[protein]-cysteine S-methyltransferase